MSFPSPKLWVLRIFLSNISVPPLFIELRYLRKPLVPSDGKWELSVIIPLESRFFLLWYSLITDEGLLATLQQYVLTSMVDHPAPELWVISIFLSSITVPPLLLELDYLWQIIISYHVNCQLFFIPPFESKFFQSFNYLNTDWGLLANIQQSVMTSLVSCPSPEL